MGFPSFYVGRTIVYSCGVHVIPFHQVTLEVSGDVFEGRDVGALASPRWGLLILPNTQGV